MGDYDFTFFIADCSGQHCSLQSAMLSTIVGSAADYSQHQKIYV